jgi:hypothetical protein
MYAAPKKNKKKLVVSPEEYKSKMNSYINHITVLNLKLFPKYFHEITKISKDFNVPKLNDNSPFPSIIISKNFISAPHYDEKDLSIAVGKWIVTFKIKLLDINWEIGILHILLEVLQLNCKIIRL